MECRYFIACDGFLVNRVIALVGVVMTVDVASVAMDYYSRFRCILAVTPASYVCFQCWAVSSRPSKLNSAELIRGEI